MSVTLVNSDGEAEAVTLEDLEEVIGRGLETFKDVGEALAKVRDGKLYLEHAETFEAYCANRWGLSRSRSYELIEAAANADAVSGIPDTPLPANAGQASALSPLKDDPHAMAEAMRMAAEATGGKPTAAAIKTAVSSITSNEPDDVDDEIPAATGAEEAGTSTPARDETGGDVPPAPGPSPKPQKHPKSDTVKALDSLVMLGKAAATFMAESTLDRLAGMDPVEWESYAELRRTLADCSQRIDQAGRNRRDLRVVSGGRT